jgi:uncharacterized protein YecT (DUF1311 family)
MASDCPRQRKFYIGETNLRVGIIMRASRKEVIISFLKKFINYNGGKMKKIILTGALICMLFSAFTLPAKDCGNAENTHAIISCHEERYKNADKELNKVYGESIKTLSPAEQQKLKESQRAWLKYRDTGLALAIELNKDARSYGDVVVADYKATVVEKRALELKHLFSGPADPPIKW